MSAPVGEILGRLRARGWRLAVAESCTGGRILARLTSWPGASECVADGVVAYDNASKRVRLGVPDALLARRGAVSGEAALAMARGVRTALGVEAGLASTGIAGPGGAGPGKPVGLVHLAASLPGASAGAPFRFDGGRERVQEAAAEQALWFLLEMLRRA